MYKIANQYCQLAGWCCIISYRIQWKCSSPHVSTITDGAGFRTHPVEMFWLHLCGAIKLSFSVYSQWFFNVICVCVCVHTPACLHGCTSDTRPVNKAPFIVPFRPSRSPSWRHCGWRREWRHRRATIVTLFGVGTTTPRFSEEWLVAPAPKEKKRKRCMNVGWADALKQSKTVAFGKFAAVVMVTLVFLPRSCSD